MRRSAHFIWITPGMHIPFQNEKKLMADGNCIIPAAKSTFRGDRIDKGKPL